jgi:uncharacterized membrane protein
MVLASEGMMPKAKSIIRAALAIAMVVIGITHFLTPDPFVRIVPAALPWPLALVYISGACEIAGGIGLFPRVTRKYASWGLIALYVAVFPANVNMAVHGIQLSDGGDMPSWAMWARLPLQAFLIVLVWWVGKTKAESKG